MPIQKRFLFGWLCAAALSALASTARASIIDVEIQNFFFNGQHLTISLGDTVRWRNLDSTTHTSTEGTDLVLNGNEAWHHSFSSMSTTTYSVTFDAAFLAANPRLNNRYDYFCVPHSGAMQGSVTVDTGPGSLFCFCYPASVCPASNRDAGAGCWNSSANSRGARMMGTGTASLTNDDLSLLVTLLPRNTTGIVYRGETQQPSAIFGDGYQCIGQPLSRFHIQPTGAAGTITVGPGIGAGTSSGISSIVPAQTWSFQCWYRDPTGPCASGVNLSNGYSVTFTP